MAATSSAGALVLNDVGGADADALALAVVLGLGAETAQQREHRADVGEIGNIAEDALIGREQCRRQRGQGGVLGAADGDTRRAAESRRGREARVQPERDRERSRSVVPESTSPTKSSCARG